MSWADLVAWFAAVPAGVWVGAIAAIVVVTLLTVSTARRRVRRAGQRLTEPDLVPSRQRAKDTMLTAASLVPAALFWLMVLAGSFHGLVAFGRTTLGWRDGWEYLVPGTLDGVSVTFAMLAFRAVRKQKTPDRCYRVVWGAAIASATINFAHEYGASGNALAGGYVGLLSLFGMVMFDEFLNQFEEGAATVRRENPKFGIRWLTWPTNTFLAAVAWRNHPPPEGTVGTVANAVANLERVRTVKRQARGNARAINAVDGPSVTTDGTSGRGELPTPELRPRRAIASRPTTGRAVPAAARDSSDDDDVRVPATAATLKSWVGIWIAMCDRADAAEGAVRDDGLARDQFGCTARQLRHVRYAAVTGALRRRAGELGVTLPAGYKDSHAA